MEKNEPCLVAFTGNSPLGHLWNRFLPWSLLGKDLTGQLHLSNLPQGTEASTQPHPVGLASWSQAAQEGRRQVGAPWDLSSVPS